MKSDKTMNRRDMLRMTALASAGAALPALLLPSAADAASKAKAAPAKAGGAKIVAEEYWGNKNGVKLWVYRKYIAAGVAAKPVLFMVHGSSYSGKTMFDLDVPGRDYSVMDHFVRLGYDVWTMDHEGYGHSDRTSSYSDIDSGVADLKVAIDIMNQAAGKNTATFFGQSSGALRAAKFANVYPQHVTSLILGALVYTGEGSRTLEKRKKQLPKLLASNVRKVDAEFYSGVFTRDKPGSADPDMGNIVAEAELKYGDTVPNGTYLDMVSKLPICDPQKIACPVLIARGEYDGIASDEDVLNFYEKLPNSDKQIAKIGGLAHTALLGVNRGRLFHVMQGFLTMPVGIPLGDSPAGGDDPG
ncbi:MAG: alpha/beta hydrolase [Solimonas sp.]